MNPLIVAIGIVVVVSILWFSWVIADQAMAKAAAISHASLWRDVRWYGQLTCRIALIGAAITPFAILGDMLITAPLQTITYDGLNAAHNSALEDLTACPDSSGVQLLLGMRNLDSAQDSANADMSLCIGDQILRNLTVEGSGARPLSGGLMTSGPSSSFLRSTFRVSYLGSTPEIPITRTVTIGSILNQTDPTGLRGPVDLGIVTIPLVGDTIDYPLDSYSTSGQWIVYPPNGMEVVTTGSLQFNWLPEMDVAATPNAGDIAWSWGYINTLGDVIEANRITSMKCFVLLIAGLPLLLFTGLLALVRPIINDPDRHKFPAELLVGVGAFLLAVVPVRAVLVPSDISQITVTDYILGTEMTVMVASSLMVALSGAMRSSKVTFNPTAKYANSGNSTGNVRPDQPEFVAFRASASDAEVTSRHREKVAGAVTLGFAGIVTIAQVRHFIKKRKRVR